MGGGVEVGSGGHKMPGWQNRTERRKGGPSSAPACGCSMMPLSQCAVARFEAVGRQAALGRSPWAADHPPVPLPFPASQRAQRAGWRAGGRAHQRVHILHCGNDADVVLRSAIWQQDAVHRAAGPRAEAQRRKWWVVCWAGGGATDVGAACLPRAQAGQEGAGKGKLVLEGGAGGTGGLDTIQRLRMRGRRYRAAPAAGSRVP